MEYSTLNLETLKKPPWLKVKAPIGEGFNKIYQILNKERLNTVCSSASCPNMGECWNRGTATFMILGNLCTRACRFCHIKTAQKGSPVDLDEPEKILKAIILMDLKHVVITSVARDDLEDGGALQFALCLKAIKKNLPHVTLEVLVPDFLAKKELIKIVTDENPDIFNHNLETIERLTPKVRSKAKYLRSLLVLKTAHELNKNMAIKSGLMLGLGETNEEIKKALCHLRDHACTQVTLGQYLRPSNWHLPVMRYATPEEFNDLAIYAKDLGFRHVKSGPLVRSSYHAESGVLNSRC